MISIKINNIDLVGCKILANVICSVRVGTQIQWTSIRYGTISADYYQSFSFKPQSHVYSISVHHNKQLTDSLITKQVFDDPREVNLILLGTIAQQLFPTKQKHISRAVYAKGNPHYCKTPLIQYEINMNVACLKEVMRLCIEHQILLSQKLIIPQPPGESEVKSIELVAEVNNINFQDNIQTRDVEKLQIRKNISEQDEEKVVFKESTHKQVMNQVQQAKQINIWRTDDNGQKYTLTRDILSNKNVEEQVSLNNQPKLQEESDSNMEEVTSKDLPDGNEDSELYMQEEEMNIIRDFVTSRQQKSLIIQRRKSQWSKNRYESPRKQAEVHLSNSKKGSFIDQQRNPFLKINHTSSDHPRSIVESYTRLGRNSPEDSISFTKQGKPNFRMQLNTIVPVEEEEDDIEKHYRGKTQPYTKLPLTNGLQSALPYFKQKILLRSPFKSQCSGRSGSSKNSQSLSAINVPKSIDLNYRQNQNVIKEYLIFNTIIFQNLDRKSEVRPTCLLLRYDEVQIYTESIREKSILFMRQIVPLKIQANDIIVISVYEQFDGQRILFGKVQITICMLRKLQESRSLKLIIEICNIRVGELIINYEFSKVNANNEEPVRIRKHSLQQQTIRHQSSTSNRKSSGVFMSSPRKRILPSATGSTILPRLNIKY